MGIYYDGTVIAANVFYEKEPGRFAHEIIRRNHDKDHKDEQVYSLFIESRPGGSLKNGPTSADIGLGVSAIKKGAGAVVNASASGEIDGLYVVVRQDGPGAASGATTSSDAAGILIDAAMYGTGSDAPGFIAAIEAVTASVHRNDITHKKIRTQVAAINANGNPAISIGFGAIADAGTNDYAFLATENGGAFSYLLWYSKAGVGRQFAIDGEGRIELGGDPYRVIVRTNQYGSFSLRNFDDSNDFCNITQSGDIYLHNTKVIGLRSTGWGAMTGTASKSSFSSDGNYFQAEATYNQTQMQALADKMLQVSRRLKAYDDMLIEHGLIGA